MTSAGFSSAEDSPWLAESISSTLPEVAEAAAVISAAQIDANGSNNAIVGRYLWHQAQVESGEAPSSSQVFEILERPLWEQGAIRLYDPITHFTFGQLYLMEAERYVVSGLSAALFSACPNTEAAQASAGAIDDIRGGVSCRGSIAEIGVDAEVISAMLEGEDELQPAREFVHQVDEILDQWSIAAAAVSTPDGAALLTSLSLVESFRAKFLVSVASDLLNLGRPHQALAVAQATLDISNPRTVSATNPALLFAVLAHAHLRTGHTREALDALEVLSGTFPSVVTVDETVGDLAVVEGLHRIGDSKEL
jgi:hypothetical protein